MCNRNTPSLTVAREALRSAMALAGFRPDVIADAELALVELIANAWRHGRTPSPVVLVLIIAAAVVGAVCRLRSDFLHDRHREDDPRIPE